MFLKGVADPGLPRGRGANHKSGSAKHKSQPFILANFLQKLHEKKLQPGAGVPGAPSRTRL